MRKLLTLATQRLCHAAPGPRSLHSLEPRLAAWAGSGSSSLPSSAVVYEVGPRDGLQNERLPVSTAIKVELINRLSAAGLQAIEATSFVSPKRVPQLADSAQVMSLISRHPGVIYPVLTPNMQGFESAVQAGATTVAVFGSASEAFSQANINCSVDDSLRRFEQVTSAAKQHGIAVRGYVSCVVACPYSGPVPPQAAARVAAALHALGCYQVSLGDTVGLGSPGTVARMFEEVLKRVPADCLAAHMHDTAGQALANLLVALQMGIRVLDASVAGLGGCPYAPGASGNVATEDVVYMLNGLGVRHGVDLEALVDAGDFISEALGRPNASRAAKVVAAARRKVAAGAAVPVPA
ncbi:hypothetical protein V8C86DRAFT_2945212 [Haematococcus lacustris]